MFLPSFVIQPLNRSSSLDEVGLIINIIEQRVHSFIYHSLKFKLEYIQA